MRILIDNSYLHSVSRCIQGNAKENTDLNNFYRFIGEIISHRSILVTAKKGESVYENTIENINIFKELGKNKTIIEYINPKNLNYISATNRVALRIQLMNLPTLVFSKKSKDINPEFKGNNPDINFHNWLIGEDKKYSSQNLEKFGSLFLPIIVVKKAKLWRKINAFINQLPEWEVSDSLVFATKIRSWIYNEISGSINASYIPSISRGHNINLNFSSPTLRKLLFTDNTIHNDFEKYFGTNNDIITSILLRNNANPIDTIKDALSLRLKIKNLREYLYKSPMLKTGDALLVYKYEKLQELIDIKNEYIENGKPLFPVESFNPVISLSSTSQEIEASIPFISSIFKTILHFRKKRLIKKMEPLLLPILQAKFSSKDDLFFDFRTNCGLYE